MFHIGIEVINIVRSEKQVEILTQEGFKNILNSSDENYETELSEIVDKMKPTVYLDAIGGGSVSQVARLMPPSSVIVIYGTLAPDNLGLTSIDILFGAKTITHFGCPFWLMSLKETDIHSWIKEITTDFENGGKIFGHPIHKIYPASDLQSAIEE